MSTEEAQAFSPRCSFPPDGSSTCIGISGVSFERRHIDLVRFPNEQAQIQGNSVSHSVFLPDGVVIVLGQVGCQNAALSNGEASGRPLSPPPMLKGKKVMPTCTTLVNPDVACRFGSKSNASE